MFITFEGIDGCGKTTQIELLRDALAQREYSVCLTREPGGTSLAETIRRYLLHSDEVLDDTSELLLFGAARAAHVAQVIRPALSRGEIVLSDRFGDSSVAYQGGGLGFDKNFVRAMNAFATDGVRPTTTFFLDLDPKIALARRSRETDDRIEARGLDFQHRVRTAFLKIADDEPERFLVLNANVSREDLHARILDILRARGLKI